MGIQPLNKLNDSKHDAYQAIY